MLFDSARRSNILPITSTCNVRCVFCSHHQNPPGIESYRIPPLTMDQVHQALALMDGGKPVVIGESVTKIMEGEPLTHPRCIEILQEIRRALPQTPIQLTTNGTLLDRRVVETFTTLAPFSINLSLNSSSNSSSCSGRTKLMQDKFAERAIKSAVLLKEYNIPFHGSVVAMPHITGWQDLTETILYLDRHDAKSVRVFLPGFTRLAPARLQFDFKMWDELRRHVDQLRTRVSVPITCEPERLIDLNAKVAGVIKNTPSYRAGIKPGDIILAVNGEEVLSRVHAFHMVLAAENPVLKIKRDQNVMDMKLKKQARESSGLVMAYDVHPDTVLDMEMAARRHRSRRVLVLCSRLAYPVLKRAVEKLYDGDCSFHIQPVKNRYFGGNIMAAGLLVVDDFDAALKRMNFNNSYYRVVLLPAVAFDIRGRDLTGKSYLELEQRWNTAVELV
nr:DUF512 domain-containing protein [Desulforadius tongensis]